MSCRFNFCGVKLKAMPGLEQLRKFSNDIREIGDESKIRGQRGESMSVVPLPEGISERDDSDDFISGLPEADKTEVPQETHQDGTGLDADSSFNMPELDSIFSSDSDNEPDLSEFLDDMNPDSSVEDVPVPESGSDNSASQNVPFEDFDLNDLMKSVPDVSDFAVQKNDISSGTDFSEPENNNSFDFSALDEAPSLEDNMDFGALDSEFDGSGEINLNSDISDGPLAVDAPVVDAELSSEENRSESDGSSFDFSDFDTSALDDFPDGGRAASVPEADSDGSSVMEELPAADSETGESSVPDAASDVPGDDFSDQSFDISDLDGLDFGNSENRNGGSSDAGAVFPAAEAEFSNEDDFVLDDFSIPGFSDTESEDGGQKSPVLDTVDFSKGSTGRPKNSLTDEEYVLFKKNLIAYPLNLRIAIEDLVVKNEFTDDAVFEIVEKVLRKAPARQLATQLEKMLDVSITIPRDYERRSFAQYEAYRQSFQYQLKNRIIPAAVVGLVLCFVCYGLFKAGQHFIYNPVMAEIHYRQGYTLLENNEFPQSEEQFKTAVSYKPIRKWFFRYASGYRQHKQYERAADMYKHTLRFFNHDKQAGLAYAEMELHERANYERAEHIVRREVLDYHINDADGLLLLGDIFLEWGGEDSSKYELAKQQYVDLIQRYGQNQVYLSRMLRYNIRTDKLRDVLTYKNIFYHGKNTKLNLKSLSADDWLELSGYLLDKMYGKLPKSDEYLRSSIEDVRAMLELAIIANPQNPIGHYNFARYFLYNGYTEQAKSELEVSLDLFASAEVRTKKNVYREINAARMLGELYADAREYLKAQTVYTRGISLYNAEHEASGFEGDENTGKLFADMGDIDYFISGELDSALHNYEKAVSIKYDTPSVNYRIGVIYYGMKEYANALSSFIKVSEKENRDPNVLFALGNTLSLRGDNFAAQSYYSDLLNVLDAERAKKIYFTPATDEEDNVIVEMYLRVNNNLGVTLYRLARQTGNSGMNAEAMVRLSDSMRAWDALTRNPETMIRLEGSNLAAQNLKYISHPYPDFEPAIYTDIPRILSDGKVLEQ